MSKYLDDWSVGEVFLTPGRTIGEYEVSAFAGLTGDYHQNHTVLNQDPQSVCGGGNQSSCQFPLWDSDAE